MAPAGAGLSGHCPGISEHYISWSVWTYCTCAHVYRVRRRDVARGHGLWRSRVNLESVGARSVHTQARVPRCLLRLRSRKGTVQSLIMLRVNFRLLHSSVTAHIRLTGRGCTLWTPFCIWHVLCFPRLLLISAGAYGGYGSHMFMKSRLKGTCITGHQLQC